MDETTNMQTKKFTLREFIDNIEKNGLPQAFGGLFYDDVVGEYVDVDRTGENLSSFVITRACALGQGYINTGVHPFRWIEENGASYFLEILPSSVIGTVISLNDSSHWNFQNIANELRDRFADRLDEVYEGVVVNYKTA